MIYDVCTCCYTLIKVQPYFMITLFLCLCCRSNGCFGIQSCSLPKSRFFSKLTLFINFYKNYTSFWYLSFLGAFTLGVWHTLAAGAVSVLSCSVAVTEMLIWWVQAQFLLSFSVFISIAESGRELSFLQSIAVGLVPFLVEFSPPLYPS